MYVTNAIINLLVAHFTGENNKNGKLFMPRLSKRDKI